MIEFVNSNSVVPEQKYKHRLEYTEKHLFLRLKIACHNACVLKIYNWQQFELCLRWYFYQAQFAVVVMKPTEKFCEPERRADNFKISSCD